MAPEIEEPILRAIDTVAPWSRWFALRAYRARHPEPSFGKLLARGGSQWHGRVAQQFLDEFNAQVGKPEDPDIFCESLAGKDSEDLEYLRMALSRFEPDVGKPSDDMVLPVNDIIRPAATSTAGGRASHRFRSATPNHTDLTASGDSEAAPAS